MLAAPSSRNPAQAAAIESHITAKVLFEVFLFEIPESRFPRMLFNRRVSYRRAYLKGPPTKLGGPPAPCHPPKNMNLIIRAVSAQAAPEQTK